MKLGLDQYAHLDSAIHRWDPRYKVVGLMALILALSFVRDLRLLPGMLLVAAILYALSRLPARYWLSRLRYPGAFLLFVAILLPFLSGTTVLYQMGPLAIRLEGCLELLRIVTKFVAILTVGFCLFGTAPFLTTIKAMRALGLPPILADMMLLSYRYVFEIGGDLGRMETAMRLRGFRAHRLSAQGLSALSSLAGTMLVRSYERSERVYSAMLLRGYGHTPAAPQDEFRPDSRDRFALAGVVMVSVSLVVAEVLLRRFGG